MVGVISFCDMFIGFSKGAMLDAIDDIEVLNVDLDGPKFDTISDNVLLFDVVLVGIIFDVV